MSSPITPLTPAQVEAQNAKTDSEGYVHRDLVGLDQFVNVLLDGNPDETISSRMARWATEDSGWKKFVGTKVSEALNLAQPDHGAIAESADLERAKTVEKIESTTGDVPPA